MKSLSPKSKGFTLIELMVVISIIALLSSIVLAAVDNARGKGSVAAGQIFSGQLKSALFSSADLFLDFDSMSAGTPTEIGVAQNQSGILPIIDQGQFLNGPGVTIVNDTSLYNRGHQLSIPASGGNNGIGFQVQGIDQILTADTFTLSTWYKPMVTNGNPNWNDPLIGIEGNAAAGGLGADYDTAGNVNTITAEVPSGPSQITTSIPVNLPANQWSQITASFNNMGGGNVQVTLYINGAVVTKRTVSGVTPPTLTSSFPLDYIIVGGFCCGAVNSGLMDDVAIYGTALADAQVKELYYAEALTKFASLPLNDQRIFY